MAGWSQAWAEKNEPAFEVLYTQSAIFQPPAGEPIRGASAIAARLSRGFDQMLVEFEREQISDGCSELYELGRFVDRRRLDRSVIATGRYLVIWKNVDGAWRIEHHAYSSAQ
ncbi:MAG: nuclear transport factor 2 family protein [Pseudomonadota bacterium]